MVGAFWIIEVSSREEALVWAVESPTRAGAHRKSVTLCSSSPGRPRSAMQYVRRPTAVGDNSRTPATGRLPPNHWRCQSAENDPPPTSRGAGSGHWNRCTLPFGSRQRRVAILITRRTPSSISALPGSYDPRRAPQQTSGSRAPAAPPPSAWSTRAGAKTTRENLQVPHGPPVSSHATQPHRTLRRS